MFRVHKAQKLPNLSIIFTEKPEEFWLPGQKAASSRWRKPWSLADFSSSTVHEDTPCKRPSPVQPCIQSNQWHTPHRGQRKQILGPPPKRQRHVQEEKGRRRSHLRVDSGSGHEAAPCQGKGSALLAAGHSPCMVQAAKSPCPKRFVVE